MSPSCEVFIHSVKTRAAYFALPFFALSALLGAMPRPQAHSIAFDSAHFLIDSKPLQIISGEMHYARIPREYWRDRMKKARAMGLNAITTYVFWNLHEPRQGVYDFSGQNDVAEYIRIAQQKGLYVILRPGPYVCSEWDLGGLPAWLLADPDITLRSADPKFLAAADRYMQHLGRELAPLQFTRGGPIIAVQVENEYGSFDRDHAYMSAIRDSIRRAGLGEVLLYTADGPSQLPAGTLPDLPAAVNFGPGEAPKAFAALHSFRRDQPIMAGEYWDGWFDSWGHPHAHTDAAQQTAELDWMLSQGASVSLYMFHGGTSFGFMNGANATREGYSPQTTSYDYDSPLDESGRPTKKFFAFRDVIAKHRDPAAAPLPDLPPPQPVISIPEIALTGISPLSRNLPEPVASDMPRTMESLGQSYGYILYRTILHGPAHGDLVVNGVRDFAAIYLDHKFIGTLDRRLNQSTISLDAYATNATLDILVENTGRINFSKALVNERKGITGSVTFSGAELHDWQNYVLPMQDFSSVLFLIELPSPHGQSRTNPPPAQPVPISAGATFYRGYFSLDQLGDTFLDTRAFTKGAVWVNGHPLGRIWRIGPQQTLYLPAPFLHLGKNEVIVFNMFDPNSAAKTKATLRGLTDPILDELHQSH